MSMYPPFTPAYGAVVTAATGAASITVPTAMQGKSHQLQIQVLTGANMAYSLTGTAEAPDGTPDSKAITLLGGNATTITVGPSVTSISYIRVGSSDATVYLTWGFGA